MTLNDHERLMSRSLRFLAFISQEGAELGYMLLLSVNKKPYTRSPMASLTLVILKGQSQGYSDVEALYLTH